MFVFDIGLYCRTCTTCECYFRGLDKPADLRELVRLRLARELRQGVDVALLREVAQDADDALALRILDVIDRTLDLMC